jgi:methyl-accepting chemotaxis protein
LSRADEVRAARERVAELGKDIATLALEIHRECGGASAVYGEMHAALNRLGSAVNRLNAVNRLLDEKEKADG